MKRYLSVVIVAACTSSSPTPEPAPAAAPAAPAVAARPSPVATTPSVPAKAPIDRSKDPAFALHALGPHRYQGRVAAQCPDGARVPTIKDADWTLDHGQLVMKLDAGGCPRWTGYTVVTGTGSPLPFYVCWEPQHDMCEMEGKFTWVFDISSALAANHATSAVFAVPTGVPGDR